MFNTQILGFDITKVSEVRIEGINMHDYPDFCDAFISEGQIDKGDIRGPEDMNDAELEHVNDHEREFVYQEVIKEIW